MKKFTLLMLLLLFTVTTSWAQLSTEQMYRIKAADRDVYLTIRGYNGEGEKGGHGTVPLVAKSVANEDQIWYLEETENSNQYYLKSKSGYYITHASWNVNAYNNTENKGIVEFINTGNDTYQIKNVNANKYYKIEWNNAGGAYFPFCDVTDQANSATWTIEIVEDSEFELNEHYAAIINLIAEAEVLYSTISGSIGTEIGEYSQETADAINNAINTAKLLTNETAQADDVTTLQTAINAVKPIKPDPNKYYQIHSSYTNFSETKAIYSDGSAVHWKSLNNDDETFYWQAVETENGFALKNVNNNKYIGGWNMSDTPVELNVKILTSEKSEKGYEYNIIYNNNSMHANNHGNGNGTGSNIVSYPGNANSASSWYIVEVEYEPFYNIVYNFKYEGDTKYTQTTALKAGVEFPESTIILPYGVTSDYTKPTGTITADGQKVYDFTLSIEKELPFATAKDVASINQWYYVRMHTNQPGYIGEIADDNTINVYWNKTATNENHADFVWGFVGNLWDGIKVINRNRNQELTSTGSGNVTLTNNGTSFFITETTETSENATNGFCLRRFDSNQYLNANYGSRKIAHWSSTDAGSTFFLAEYKEHTVNVSEAGYATLFLDYSVYIPENVEAYVANSQESNFINLEQVTGTLPANTGVILKNAGKHTFPLSITEATADVTNNILEGSVTTTEYTDASYSYYFLFNGNNGVGFYKDQFANNKFVNNANKAFFRVATTNPAPNYSFNFDWSGTTGIEAIESEETTTRNGAIYDITGRQVKAMTAPGLYIVGGKKIVVK